MSKNKKTLNKKRLKTNEIRRNKLINKKKINSAVNLNNFLIFGIIIWKKITITR